MLTLKMLTPKPGDEAGTKPRPGPRAGEDPEAPSTTVLQALLPILLAGLAGAVAAVVVMPAWLPSLSASLAGPAPKSYWYLTRSSGLVAYWLLWLSMALGLTITNRWARVWPGGPAAVDVHQHASLLSLAFTLLHAAVLLGERHVGYDLREVLVPFASDGYRPLWVGLGQVGFYVLALVTLSFWVRGQIGHRLWRLVHLLSFVCFVLALVHSVASGTDTETPWAAAMYWTSGASLLLLASYRLLTAGAGQPVGR